MSGEQAKTKTYGDCDYYVNNDNTATITKYTGSGGNVTIPSSINGKSVNSIGNDAFYQCMSLTSATIPDSVTIIGVGAFSFCSNLTISGISGSYAETYAKEKGIPFKPIKKPTPPLNNNSILSGSAITLGKSVSITCNASGGTAPYRYTVKYRKVSSQNWTTLQQNSTNKTAKFSPASAVRYKLYVKVRDSSGKIAKKYFTLNVTR